MRRPGKQYDNVLAAVELSTQPLSGSGAVRIGKHGGPVQNVGLLGVVGGHVPASLGEALFQASEDFRIAMHTQAQSFSHCLSRKIVFRGAEAAAENQNVRTKQAVLRRGDQPPKVVAHNAFENYVDAQQVELFGEIERVGVHAEGREHLGTHRNDFGIHSFKV